tara:strand:- start:220 stop:675 length:456 start_codon:yes stop_codon:yes gene_type:complete
MEISLKKDEMIILYLKVFIPIPEICNKIIKIKNESENKDTLKYHIDRWNSIAGEHYYTRDNHYGKFSQVLNRSYKIDFKIKPDHRVYFYQMTGISYQVIELIYELIKIRNEKSWDFEIDNKEDRIKHDDKLYSELSKRIMNEMKQIKLLFI